MLIPFWFKTNHGPGYGVTAPSQQTAERLLKSFGYPRPGERVVSVTAGIQASSLDPKHVLPNAGPIVTRGVWFPRHNV
jgi:hypothetical protein